MIKYDNFGSLSWEKTFSSNDVSDETYDWAGEAIDLTNDGGGIIAVDNGQFGFLRINNVQNTLVNDYIDEIPTSYNLYNNYPNPFNPSTTLQYDLSENSFVDVTIYDVFGNVVNNLVFANQTKGFKSVQWNSTNNDGQPVASGIYLYSIKAENFRKTKRMIFLK